MSFSRAFNIVSNSPNTTLEEPVFNDNNAGQAKPENGIDLQDKAIEQLQTSVATGNADADKLAVTATGGAANAIQQQNDQKKKKENAETVRLLLTMPERVQLMEENFKKRFELLEKLPEKVKKRGKKLEENSEMKFEQARNGQDIIDDMNLNGVNKDNTAQAVEHINECEEKFGLHEEAKRQLQNGDAKGAVEILTKDLNQEATQDALDSKRYIELAPKADKRIQDYKKQFEDIQDNKKLIPEERMDDYKKLMERIDNDEDIREAIKIMGDDPEMIKALAELREELEVTNYKGAPAPEDNETAPLAFMNNV